MSGDTVWLPYFRDFGKMHCWLVTYLFSQIRAASASASAPASHSLRFVRSEKQRITKLIEIKAVTTNGRYGQYHGRMARGGHGLPNVSLWPAKPKPSTPCRPSTPEMAQRAACIRLLHPWKPQAVRYDCLCTSTFDDQEGWLSGTALANNSYSHRVSEFDSC
jgi:hypothetical protein